MRQNDGKPLVGGASFFGADGAWSAFSADNASFVGASAGDARGSCRGVVGASIVASAHLDFVLRRLACSGVLPKSGARACLVGTLSRALGRRAIGKL